MTYEDLYAYIGKMTPEQRQMTVTVHLPEDEFIAVHHAELTNDQEEDRLDDGHPYLVVLGAEILEK